MKDTGRQKILIVHNYYKIPGGEDTVVANEKRLLEAHGHEVILYTRSNAEMDEFFLWRKLLLPLTSIFSFKTYREVKRLIKKEKIEIVHVHNTLNLISPSVYYAAFFCHIPVVQTLHNFRMLCPAATFLRDGKVCEECVERGLGCAVKHRCYRDSQLQSFASAAILKVHRLLGTYRRLFYICLTDFNREKLLLLNRKRKKVVNPKHVFTKPNFVAENSNLVQVKKEHYVYVGRLEKLKGVRVLLEAWEEFPGKRLLLCGRGPEEDWIRSYIEKHQMNQVELLGQIPHAEVQKIIGESQALILPTLCYEGQPMVILESFAAGTPVIASDIGNAGNMTEPGITGERFRCGDAESLRNAVRRLERKEQWAARAVYEEKYTEEENYRILNGIYEKIWEKSR